MARLLVASFSVCPSPDRHGAQLANVLKALAPRFELDVMTLRTGDLPYVERHASGRMLRVPVGDCGLLTQAEIYARALRRQLEGEEYDLIHLRSAWGARAVLRHASTQARIIYEVSYSLVGAPVPGDEESRQRWAEEEAACLERADLVLVPNESGRSYLERRGLGERAVVVPPGVDIDEFDWQPDLDRAWLPAGPASEEGEPGPALLVFAGRLAPGRGVRLLVRAVKEVRRAHPLRLLLAGPVAADFVPVLDQAIAEAGLAPFVSRLGPIVHRDLPRVLSLATVCVAPIAPDAQHQPLASCPRKVLEYLACRRALVAPRSSAVADVVRDGRDGLLFAPDDAHDLAAQIGRLLGDAELRESIADSGYQRVRSRFPASATRRSLLEAYARIGPPSGWLPPARLGDPLGVLPGRLDSTTLRHPRVCGDRYLIAEAGEELEVSDIEEIDDRDVAGARAPRYVRPEPPDKERG